MLAVSLYMFGDLTIMLVAGMHAESRPRPRPWPQSSLGRGAAQLGMPAILTCTSSIWHKHHYTWLTSCGNCNSILSTLHILCLRTVSSSTCAPAAHPLSSKQLSDGFAAAAQIRAAFLVTSSVLQSQPASQAKHFSLCDTHVVEPKQ